MDEKQMIHEVVESYIRTGCEKSGDIRIERIQDRKTTFVEPNGDGGRSIYMNEYKLDGKIYYVGYSSRSQTVYISMVA
jgi:hypothetical protein